MTSPVYKRLTAYDSEKLSYPCKVCWWDRSNGELIIEFSKWGYGTVISDTRSIHVRRSVGYTTDWNAIPDRWYLIVEEVEYDPLQNGDTEEDI